MIHRINKGVVLPFTQLPCAFTWTHHVETLRLQLYLHALHQAIKVQADCGVKKSQKSEGCLGGTHADARQRLR